MILAIATLTLNLASVRYAWIWILNLLKVPIQGLRNCVWLENCSCLIKFLDFVCNACAPHKAIFLIVFQLLFAFLESFLMNNLVIVEAVSYLFSPHKALVKNVLLFLTAIYCRNSSLTIFPGLCSDCLTRNDTKLVINRHMASWIRRHSSNSTDISWWLPSVPTTRLWWSSRLANKAADTNRRRSVHYIFLVIC